MADVRLNDCQKSRLIELIRDHPCIWDARCPDYSNRDRSREARIYICRQMDNVINEEQLMKKYRNLRTQYGKCLQAYQESKKSGCSTGDVKQPTWKFFQLLDFLRPCVAARRGRDNMGCQDREGGSHPLITEQLEEEEQQEEDGDLSILLSQVERHQPNGLAHAYSEPSIAVSLPPLSQQPSASAPIGPQIPPASPQSSNFHGGPPSKRKRTPSKPPAAAHAVSLLQTLVEKRPTPAAETENDLFFRMCAKLITRVPERKQDKLRMDIHSMIYKAISKEAHDDSGDSS